MKITDNVFFYRGDSPHPGRIYPGMASSNFVVIRGEEQIMIDTGMQRGAHRGRILKELRTDGIDLNDTKYIFFTHYHPDHITGAKPLLKRKGVKLLFHRECEKYLNDGDYQFYSHINAPYHIRKEIFPLPKVVIKMFLRYIGYDYDYFRGDYLLESNVPITIGGLKIVPIPTFGHCPGHLSYYLPKWKLMVCGDVFSLNNHFGSQINSPASDFETAIKDIDLLLSMDINILLPAHDYIFIGKNLREALESSKEKDSQLADQVLTAIGSGRLTLSEIRKRLFNIGTDIGFRIHYDVSIYNILKYLVKLGKVKSELRDNRIWWMAQAAE